ncbi:MAG TPA: hypothetical protein VF450_15165 [Noviherbaspirillum sp.]
MIDSCAKIALNSLFTNDFLNFDTMHYMKHMAWYRVPIMASRRHHTIKNAMKKCCLPLPIRASQCQTK